MRRIAEAGATPAKLPVLIQYAHLDHPYRDALLDTLTRGKRYFAIPQGTVVPYSVLEDAVRVFDSARPGYWRQEKSLRQLFDETIPVMQRMIDQWLERNPQ